MATASRDELQKTDFLKLADSSSGKISKVIAPNELQVGLDDEQFKSGLTVKGTLSAEQGITVADGQDFIHAGSNISVTKNSDGSLSIAATGFTNNPLTVSAGAGTMFSDGGTTYDGSTAQRLEIDIYQNRGLSIHPTAGLRIDHNSASNGTPVTGDKILFGDISDGTATKWCSINEILILGSPATVTNAISFGTGIHDSASGAGSWNNSAPATVSIDLASNGGITAAGGSGAIRVDPNNATATTTVDLTNDYVLIHDDSAGATRKLALQYIAATALNGLTIGNGLSPNGTAYNGSAGVTLDINPADATISSTAAGISVLSVPNTLIPGDGIQPFAFNGSASDVVAVNRSTTGGLNFDSSSPKKLQLDINNLVAGPAPAITDEIAISFGTNDSRKVDVGTLGNVITSGIISSTVWVDANDKAYSTGSISIDSAGGTAESHGTDVFFYVSGSVGNDSSPNANKSVFGGDVFATGSVKSLNNITALSGFSGSLTTLADGSPYLIAGTNITLSTSSAGAITINSTGGGGGGGGSIGFQSGSTSVATVTTVNTSQLGTIQDLGGGTIAITGSIGNAEDGSYSDGLFVDFNTTTPIGTAVDRFNEVLKGLAPGAAPGLDDLSCSDSGTTAVLSFGSSQSITDYTNVQPSSLSPTNNLSDVDINGTYSSTTTSNDVRVACFTGGTVINGILNADVPADGVNYEQYSFGNGSQGTLKLYVNDNTTPVHSVDLSTFGSGDHLNADSSGFTSISSANPGHFADGSSFSTFQHRTGSYQVGTATQRDGWNWARVVHTIGGIDTTCNYAEWVNDPSGSVNDISAAGSVLDSLAMTGIRKLSGARYNTGGTAQYRVRVSNAYRNVYSTSNITFGGSNCSVPAQSFPVIDFAGGENETKVLHITGSATINADPILNGSITTDVNVPHPLKSNLSSAGSQSISGILLYNLSNTSTNTLETFRSEDYRLISGSYDNQASVTDAANTWDSALHMSGTNAGHEDGLLFYNSRLYAPAQGAVSGDFRNTADGGSITNGPGSNVNYSGITTGTRTFYRYFRNTTGGSKANFSISINGSGTIVSQGTALNTANIHVLLKVPTTSAPFSTGWMDLALPFATGQNQDGAGCLDGGLDSSLNATNNGTFGTQFVGNNEYAMIKIEADATWTGYISQIDLTWT